jgi:hypothetical protein
MRCHPEPGDAGRGILRSVDGCPTSRRLCEKWESPAACPAPPSWVRSPRQAAAVRLAQSPAAPRNSPQKIPAASSCPAFAALPAAYRSPPELPFCDLRDRNEPRSASLEDAHPPTLAFARTGPLDIGRQGVEEPLWCASARETRFPPRAPYIGGCNRSNTPPACGCRYPGRISRRAPSPLATVPGCVPPRPAPRSRPAQRQCTARRTPRVAAPVAPPIRATRPNSATYLPSSPAPRHLPPNPSYNLTVAYSHTRGVCRPRRSVSCDSARLDHWTKKNL